jgi:RAT1-interacting protein
MQRCAEGGLGRYIELKTNKIINTEKEQFGFERYKLLKFWAQSFIIGIPEVVVGFRDHAGICMYKGE